MVSLLGQQSVDSRVQLPGCQFWLHRVNDILRLSFLICKLGRITDPAAGMCWDDQTSQVPRQGEEEDGGGDGGN